MNSSSCSTPSSPIHGIQTSSSSSNIILQPKNLLKTSKPENNYLLNKSSSHSELVVNPSPLPPMATPTSSGGGNFHQKRCFNNNNSNNNINNVNNHNNSRLYNNISKSDPKLLDNFFTPPQPAPVQQRVASLTGLDGRRSVMASPLHSIGASKLQGCQSVPDCVYLRPEQNIPDIFANTKFQPIGGSRDKQQSQGGEMNGGAGSRNGGGGGGSGDAKMQKDSQTRISRDDIVVTVRSAQV